MPLVRIEIIKGKSPDYKKKMLNCVHNGLIDALGIEDWDRFQRIVEIDPLDFETSPEKTDQFTIIELTLFPGRSKQQKKAVIERITSRLNEELSIAPKDIFIVINEPPFENWGMGGKQKEGWKIDEMEKINDKIKTKTLKEKKRKMSSRS